MSEHSVCHATFSLERTFNASAAQVFAAWADPVAKGRWFAGPDADHQLDFRVGGREINHRRFEGTVITFESLYRDIIPDERIVYTSTLAEDGAVATVSLTTVTFTPAEEGTRLILTEQGTFLDGRERQSWREQGTSEWLDALGAELLDRASC
jgi:uncharacterized protein YndB with AHSA1/START domain